MFVLLILLTLFFVSVQRLKLKKRLGYRDGSKYAMSAGDGANMKLKRQG